MMEIIIYGNIQKSFYCLQIKGDWQLRYRTLAKFFYSMIFPILHLAFL